MIKVIAIVNICLIISCIWLMSRYLVKHSCDVYDDYKAADIFKKGGLHRLHNLIKRNANFFSIYILRLTLCGIFLNNLSKLNTGYLNLTPDYQFYLANAFYMAFVIRQFVSYKRENKLERIIGELQETIKNMRG